MFTIVHPYFSGKIFQFDEYTSFLRWVETFHHQPPVFSLFLAFSPSRVFPEVLVQWYIRFIWIVSHLVQIWMPRSPYTPRSGPGKIWGNSGALGRWWFQHLHQGRLTWNLHITHLERNMIFQTSMIMFHVNLQGCKSIQILDEQKQPVGGHQQPLKFGSQITIPKKGHNGRIARKLEFGWWFMFWKGRGFHL